MSIGLAYLVGAAAAAPPSHPPLGSIGLIGALAEVSNQNILLQHAFLRDVAGRLVVERKFNSLTEVQAQEQKILSSPARIPTLESIYAGLNVEVTSNGVARVIAPE